MAAEVDIPDYGAAFTFGRSCFADNQPSHFFIRNDPISEISCGDEHTALICQNGRVFVFGHNDYGQLGLGHTKVVTKPSCVKLLKPFKSRHVACGKGHTLVSTECGQLFSMGSNSDGQLGLGDLNDRYTPHSIDIQDIKGKIVQLAAGCLHSALMTDMGEVYTWGSNADGQCGQGEDVQFLKPTKLGFHSPISWISCGYYHSAIICGNEVYTFGEGDTGKLGLSKSESQNYPQCVAMDGSMKAVECGGNHTVVLSECGDVYVFGSNFSGQIGMGTVSVLNAPQRLSFQTPISSVSCGESHTMFLTDSGDVYTCGDARHGKLAIFDEQILNLTEPILVEVVLQQFIKLIACGGCQSMLIGHPRNTHSDADIIYPQSTALPPLKFRRPSALPETIELVKEDESQDNLSTTESDINMGESEIENQNFDTKKSSFDDDDVNFAAPLEDKKIIEEKIEIGDIKEEHGAVETKPNRIKQLFGNFRRRKSSSCAGGGDFKDIGSHHSSKACSIL